MNPVFIFSLLVAFAAATDLCTVPGVGVGVCISTSSCTGTSTPGYCPGSSSIQCCTGIICGNTGLCMQTSECTGAITTGLCPGPSSYACCKSMPCDNGKGKCTTKATCSDTMVTGLCPGPSNYICCEDSQPSTGGGEKVVAAARSMVGKYPYSWGGGNNYGATLGIAQTSSPYCDDRNVLGFDCSGLAKYSVYQGTGISLTHRAQIQYSSCSNKVSLTYKKPGDLVFFGSSKTSITHVAIYVGDGMMVEAPGHNPDCSGKLVRETTLRTSRLIDTVCRYW